jgi:hypothetical protein
VAAGARTGLLVNDLSDGRPAAPRTNEDGDSSDFTAVTGPYLRQRRHAGEMYVNIGGDPERDDYDLPAVDIEIPDDARELDRDVQAYRRELRARRRYRLVRRLHGPLTRGGMVLPLLASCLALTLLAGATLTMFSAGRVVEEPLQRTATAGHPAPTAGQVGALLPERTAQVDGRLISLRSLMPAALALIPAGCRCATALQQLSMQAAAADVPIYLVGTGGWMTEVKALATGSGKDSAHVMYDASDVLGSAYHRTGLTAVLVYADGSVSKVQRNLGPGVQLGSSLRALASDGPPGLAASPGAV